MIRKEYITIHHALHSDAAVVTINNIDYPIQQAGQGSRYVDFEGVRVMQQNKYKDSKWAKQARAGEHITWAQVQPKWIRIDKTTIPSPKTKEDGGS